MVRTTVVITGSTRGLGYCMAREFLRRGCAVVVSGRSEEAVRTAVSGLRGAEPGAEVHGVPCDTGQSDQVERLWQQSAAVLGAVDHWILNAGIGQPTRPIWEVPPALMEEIVRTDLLGVMYGARTAMQGMLPRGRGAIWFMEGHGSDGAIRRGVSVYGAAKRALRYTARALAREARGTGILVGALSPGIMVTDFITRQLDSASPGERERSKKVFNILADRPEVVARFLVPRILSARKSGTLIAWLTMRKAMFRFMTAGLSRRKVID